MKILLLALLLASPIAAADLAVAVSTNQGPDFANKTNDADVEVARFTLSATSGSVSVDDITITFSNETMADDAFSQLRLFYDADGNSTFAANEELDTGKVPNGTSNSVTFAEVFSAPDTFSYDLQIRADINNTSTFYGEAFSFSVNAGTDVTLTNGGSDTVSGTFPATSNSLTIRHSENQLVPGTGNPSAPRDVNHNSTNNAALHFIIDCLAATPNGELVGIDLDSITISLTLGAIGEDAGVAALSLYADDGDGLFEPTTDETEILRRTATDITKWVVSGTVITVTFDGSAIANLADILSGQSRVFWVGIDFAGSMDVTVEASVNRTGVLGALGADADYLVASPANINGNVINVRNIGSGGGGGSGGNSAAEPSGENGCASSNSPTLAIFLSILVLLAVTFVRKLPLNGREPRREQ
ncbi:MAG: hypothetical protein ACYTDT_13695 [Planctomycetota bacterium]|jgi:hypothetical protein